MNYPGAVFSTPVFCTLHTVSPANKVDLKKMPSMQHKKVDYQDRNNFRVVLMFTEAFK